MLLSSLFAAGLFVLSSAQGPSPQPGYSESVGPVGTLNVVNKVIAPDGFPRSTVLVNGQFPGPLIAANKGDRFSLNVVDSLTDPTMLRSTSIHWHGLFQDNSSWADGTAFVTQCPIAANHSFLYDFVPTGQTGTYWYHSHLATQYQNGLRGPLVIYDPQDPHKNLYDVDNDSTVITLADWYHYKAEDAPQVPAWSAVLVNGFGRNPAGPAGPAVPLAVLSVVRNLRYRFRIVSISFEPNFIFSIDNHTLSVIEADGVSTQPLTVDSLQIFSGQRYSVVLNANQPVNNYWIRVVPNFGNTSFINAANSAILRYFGAFPENPNTPLVPSVNPLLETNLHPLVPSPVPGNHYPGGADINLQFIMNLDFTTIRYTVNNVSFYPPTAPVLLQIMSGAKTAQELLPAGSVFPLPKNKVIEITIPGGGPDGSVPGGPHPWHLHGHNFYVVRSAGSDSYNWDNPVIRDVVNTGDVGDNMTLRFVTDNAGPWFLHCHIDTHLELGLAVVLTEDAGDVAHDETVPAAWNNLCPIYDSLSPSQQ